MFKQLLISSIKFVIDHPMVVRIAFLTGFVETLMSFWRYWNFLYVILEHNVDISNIQWTLGEFLKAIFSLALDNISFRRVVLLLFLRWAWYLILYPFWYAMMVAYAQHKSVAKSFNIAVKRYFTTTIAHTTLSFITLGSWHLWLVRYFYSRQILDNILIQIFLILVWSFLLVTTFIYAYANITAISDDFDSDRPMVQSQEALKHSSKVAMKHPFITIKFLIFSLLLQIRFFLTTIFVIGIPAVLIWFLIQLWLIGETTIIPVTLISSWILLLFGMYVNSIVDAFFAVYRYQLYDELKNKSEE